MDTATITLGGKEYTLTRPKGRQGRRLVATMQNLMRIMTPAINALAGVQSTDDLSDKQVDTLLQVSADLFLLDDLKFEDEILPSMLMFSTAKMSKEKAIAVLDEIDDPPNDVMQQFFVAASFWMSTPDRDTEEALEEAQKK